MSARLEAKSEVNITPFVDVMLVLLIIFMVAAPLATVALKVDLPSPDDGQLVRPADTVFVSLHRHGIIHVGTEQGEIAGDWRSLTALLREMSRGDRTAPVFVRADRDVAYGDLVRLIDTVRASGYRQVAIVPEDPG